MERRERPAISGSMAGHCRMEIWLLGHGRQREEVHAGAQRTFDLGFIIEAAMLRGVEVDAGLPEPITVGPWFPNVGTVRDLVTGQSFESSEAVVTDFQREVQFAGYGGHIDGILHLPTGAYVLDVKTTQGFGYDRYKTSNLALDPFAKEYVAQLHFYMQGLIDAGEPIVGGLLLFFNKEQSQVMARFVEYDPAIVENIRERLSWATRDAEPEPDWVWTKGLELPLRCGYCMVREACSEIRGLRLEQSYKKNGKPLWRVAV